PGHQPLSVTGTPPTVDRRGDHGLVAEHTLYPRHGPVDSFIGSTAPQPLRVVSQWCDRLGDKTHPAHRGARPLHDLASDLPAHPVHQIGSVEPARVQPLARRDLLLL